MKRIVTVTEVKATNAVAFHVPHPDGASCHYVPYPGWRIVPDGTGGLRHEKIPSLWEHIKFTLRAREYEYLTGQGSFYLGLVATIILSIIERDK